jgi:hypothetical protein
VAALSAELETALGNAPDPSVAAVLVSRYGSGSSPRSSFDGKALFVRFRPASGHCANFVRQAVTAAPSPADRRHASIDPLAWTASPTAQSTGPDAQDGADHHGSSVRNSITR